MTGDDAHDYFSNSSSPARLVAFTTALMSVTRSLPSSSSECRRCAAGRSSHGVLEEARDDRRFPTQHLPRLYHLRCEKGRYIARQTDFHASFGSDSRMMYAKAGPLAERPVTAFMCFSSRTIVRPTASEHRAEHVEMMRAGMGPGTECRHATVNSGRSIWHCSHDWHLVALAACGRGDLLLDEACRHRAATETDQRVGRQFREHLLQHVPQRLRFIVSKRVSAFDRFAIVGGYRNAELLRDRGCSLRMLYSRGDSIGHKQSLLQNARSKDATQFTGTEYASFFVGSFGDMEKE